MLIGIDARITPDLLHCLAAMGHGDELVVADANFPSSSIAAHCIIDEPIALAGVNSPMATDLITRLMPLDDFHDYGALRMQVDDAPDAMPDVHQEAWKILDLRRSETAKLSIIERQAFYTQARDAFAVVRTCEQRPYGCFILRKGVVF